MGIIKTDKKNDTLNQFLLDSIVYIISDNGVTGNNLSVLVCNRYQPAVYGRPNENDFKAIFGIRGSKVVSS